MTRSLCALAFLAAAVCVAYADDKDPVKDKLFAAKVAYDAELRLYRKDAGDWFDKREDAARNDGNKKLVDQIKAERKAFDETGELPKAAPAAVRQKPAMAKKTLEAAYAQAVKEYTKAKKDDEAAAVEEAWKAFAKGTPDEPPAVVAPAGGTAGAMYSSRSGAAKAKLIEEGGASAESEKAVALSLTWLAKQQKADGSWAFDQGRKEETAAATGLVLLAYLGAGETHRAEKGKHKETVRRGVNWLAKAIPTAGPNAGRATTNVYAQAIATLALCEAYGMTKDPALKPAAQAAVNYIHKTQAPNGSWGYTPGTNGDTSIVGWQIQALQAARASKELVVDDKVIKRASKFLDSTAGGAKKAMYGYADSAGAKPGTALTAVGLLSRYYADAWGPGHPGMVDGVAGLTKNPPAGGAIRDMYYYYYAAQVVHYFGGEDWKEWNEGPKGTDGSRKGGLRDWLVGEQIREGAEQGSWDAEKGHFGTECGRLGTTAVCVLTLEVYYRHVPLHKLDKGDAGKKPEDK